MLSPVQIVGSGGEMKTSLKKLRRNCTSLVVLIVCLIPTGHVLAWSPTSLGVPEKATGVLGQPALSVETSVTILGYHTVRKGETLFCIARAYGVDPMAIADANGVLTPSLILPGLVLAIPNVPRTLPSGPVCAPQFSDAPEPPVEPPTDCRWHHPVLRGENLFRISLRYGVSMYAIAEANGISNLNLIYASQTLCIP